MVRVGGEEPRDAFDRVVHDGRQVRHPYAVGGTVALDALHWSPLQAGEAHATAEVQGLSPLTSARGVLLLCDEAVEKRFGNFERDRILMDGARAAALLGDDFERRPGPGLRHLPDQGQRLEPVEEQICLGRAVLAPPVVAQPGHPRGALRALPHLRVPRYLHRSCPTLKEREAVP